MNILDTPGLADEISVFFSEQGNHALFAGAGVGARASLPTWAQLMESLAKVAEEFDEKEAAGLIRKRNESKHYLNAATIYKTCMNIPEGERYKRVAVQFDNPKSWKTNSPAWKQLNSLMSLPFVAVFTTNYDRSLHHAYSEVTRRPSRTVELKDPTMKMALFEQDFYIARIHGRAEVPQSIVLDDVDYSELLSNQDYLDLLIHAFNTYRFLFVGFSFSDPAISHVLDIVERRFSPNFPELHTALLPDNADEALIARLARFNIKTVFYDSFGEHYALWEGIKVASRKFPMETKVEKPQAEFPLRTIQRFLATSYAQLKMSKAIHPLRDVVIDGMLITLLKEAETRSISYDHALEKLRTFLRISVQDGTAILEKRIDFLEKEGRLTQENNKIKLSDESSGSYDLSNDLKILTRGVENRIIVRQSGKINNDILSAAENSIESIILARGWDLGASYVGAEGGDKLDITSTIRAGVAKHSGKLSNVEKENLYLACFDLFQNPSNTESEVLSLMGRVSFALQIVLNKPSEAVAHFSLLPELIYLDSNVLMPAIVNGHPFQHVYSDALRRLDEACKNAGISISVIVTNPFLAEVLNHRKLALEEVDRLQLEDPERLYDHIQFHGASTNVFISAYSSVVGREEKRIHFREFLKTAAPYEKMSELQEYVAKLGIKTMPLSFIDREYADYYKYLNKLEEKYDQEAEFQRKKYVLIEDEARQLYKIKLDLDKRLKVLFVTMDNRLRKHATGPLLGYPGSALVTHNGFIQLIDMLIGLQSDSGSVARLLWGSFVSDEKLAIINYFTNLALSNYSEAMAMSLSEVLESFVPRISAAAKKEGISLLPGGNTTHKEKLASFMDRFEDDFYEQMAEVIKKHQRE